ncbi:DUF262 domain-containing protein [Aliarcobacter cryaerophilus]|uniref:DUF262 domain-containing protein n=1 Tax=Aliarcobacter cryaerophilus TaxID=28198 RepID=UPI0013DDBE61|nr:DUF262 domain-containing protein [Aliarcobacter cryaerophilus]
MALSLTAEQKSILKIFNEKNKYIIPPYQRPYSWGIDECIDLFEDLKQQFFDSKEEGYFLGNIVLTNTLDKRYDFEVIDGQQRLTTIIMFLKVLYHFDKKNNKLKNSIWILNDRTDEILESRLHTNIFIEKDKKSLEEVLDESYIYRKPKDKKDRFKSNVFYLYEAVKNFVEEGNDIEAFIDFFIYDVTLLPIQTEGTSTSNAREKALKIFETINDRGLSLSNSDILKSAIYFKSNKAEDTESFIKKWKLLEEDAQTLNISLDRVFKIYSYKIRGIEGVKSPEIGLRDFFLEDKISPFKTKNYNEILNDLIEIIATIQLFQMIRDSVGMGELTKWFQLIELYTNNFPKDLIIIFMIANKDINESIRFAKSLVRYCYFKGSTTSIKYDIYEMTIKVMHNTWEEFYPEEPLDKNSFSYFGRLYKGFTLLGAYLNENQEAVNIYTSFKRVKDLVSLDRDSIYYYDSIGSYLPYDINQKKIISDFLDTRYLLENKDSWNLELENNRVEDLRDRFFRFFGKTNEN